MPVLQLSLFPKRNYYLSSRGSEGRGDKANHSKKSKSKKKRLNQE
ncbi:MAG: hypothetical protein ACMUEL_06185 [Flavobacteriales bacterium Tduv]